MTSSKAIPDELPSIEPMRQKVRIAELASQHLCSD